MGLPETLPSFDNESELIRQLYGSLIDKQGFHAFLQLLGDAIDASACTLSCLQRKPIAMRYLWHMGLPDGFVADFNERGMLERDTVFNLAVRNSLRGFSTASDALQEMQQVSDPGYWAESYEMSMRMGYRQAVWMVVHAAEDNVVVLSLMRRASQEQYTDQELQKINRLVPHIRQAFQLYEQVNRTMIQTSSLRAVLDAVPKPSVVLSELSQVIHVNRAGRDLLAGLDMLRIIDDQIRFRDARSQTIFAQHMVEVLRSSIGLSPFYSVTQYLERPRKPDLILCLSPIENIDQNRGGALLTLIDPEARELPRSKRIGEYFSLTNAEALLCQDLVLGLSLKEVAARRHKSEATLRSYLKQIYAKTGYNRQGQLVSSILSSLIE